MFVFLLTGWNVQAKEVKFCAVGDILLDRGVKNRIRKNGVNYPFQKVFSLIKKNDLAFCNLECPVSLSGTPSKKTFCFHAKPTYLNGVKNAGFNVISIANNHILDWGRDAFLETKTLLEKNGLYPVGGGKTQIKARGPTIIECKGLKFAFFGYVLLRGMTYRADRPAPAWAGTDEIIKEIKKIRNKVDFVIVSLHWGIEFKQIPTGTQVKRAHRLIDAGADLILGHHSHVLQSIEYYKGKYIVYSLGNFVFDQHKLYRKQSMIFGCTFKKEEITSAYFIPILLKDFRPHPAKGENAKKIIKKVKLLSNKYNIKLIETSDKVFLMESYSNLFFGRSGFFK